MTEVGSVDTLKGYATLGNSGDLTEINWVNTVLGTDFTVAELEKTDTPSGALWEKVTGDATMNAVYAFDFVSESPAYFYIKVGSGSGYTHYLYENIASLDWAVINLDLPGGLKDIKNVGKLSHIGEVGSTPVPEPTTTFLFTVGLLGFAGITRRRMK